MNWKVVYSEVEKAYKEARSFIDGSSIEERSSLALLNYPPRIYFKDSDLSDHLAIELVEVLTGVCGTGFTYIIESDGGFTIRPINYSNIGSSKKVSKSKTKINWKTVKVRLEHYRKEKLPEVKSTDFCLISEVLDYPPRISLQVIRQQSGLDYDKTITFVDSLVENDFSYEVDSFTKNKIVVTIKPNNYVGYSF